MSDGATTPDAGRDGDDRLGRIFAAALELPPAERPAFVIAASEGDADLAALVLDLLAHHDAAPPLLQEPERLVGALPAESLPQAAIGPYRLRGVLGQGGMGIVYRAEQERPRREVALKVMTASALLAGAARRFAREAELLGRLQHPGIARVYDAGVYPGPTGDIACFAMELVHGQDLLTWARGRSLDHRACCAMLARVAGAVQHAHERGVVHRDLKPANILIDESVPGDAQPKVLDFGVARATDHDLEGGTLLTRTGQVVGTLAYMSPEQVRGDTAAIGPASDVYALGVILYELLTGRLPIDVAGVPFAVAAQRICEADPTGLRHVDTRLRGDLDTIVATALAKEPGRRYASAQAFADDLARFLADRPIQARRATLGYRAAKFVRRHRALVAGAGLAFVALATGLGVAVAQAASNAELADTERQVRRVAETTGAALRRALYRDQMQLAALALTSPAGSGRARALLDAWAAPGREPDVRGIEWHLFAAQLKDTVPPRLLDERVVGMDWHPWLPRLAVGTYASVHVFDLPAGTEPWPVASVPRRGVEWSADGSCLLSGWFAGFDIVGANDGRVRAHVPVDDGREPTPKNQTTGAFAFHPDGRTVAIGTFRGDLLAVDWRSGQRIARHADGASSECLAFDRAGTRLATVDRDGPVVRPFPGPGDLVRLQGRHRPLAMAFGGDGRNVAGAGDALVLWDATTGAELAVQDDVHQAWQALAFAPDGRRLAAANADRSVRIWQPPRRTFDRMLLGHTGQVQKVAWSPDGRWLASGSRNYELCLWDLSAPAAHRLLLPPAHQVGETRLQFVGDGRELLAVHDKGARRADLRPGSDELLEAAPLAFATWDRAGARLAFWREGKLVVRDARGERELPLPQGGEVTGLAWRPGTDQLGVCAAEHFTVLDSDSGAAVAHWRVEHDLLRRPVWTADGRRVVLALPLYTLFAVDPFVGTVFGRLRAPGLFGLRGHDVRADGSLVAVACDNGAVLVVGEDLQARHRLQANDQPVRSVAFHPHEDRLAAVGDDGWCRLWDPVAGELVAAFEVGSPLAAVAWRADGRALAVLRADGVLEVWDAGGAGTGNR